MMIIEKSFKIFEEYLFDFSINLSFEDIINPEICDFIIEKLRTSNMGHRVTFELLESEKVQDFNKVLLFFYEIKRYGAKVAIDDFGSGFSNFSYVIKLKPDFIKIDGSLIKELDKDRNAQIVVETIVSFSKKLGIKTVAEFVHSSTVLSAVKQLGIDYSQGYYIDMPSPVFGS
jgi:EAL domain-containing protein (putative c-di-GMP-specific phosphodiesterase class I)